MISYASATVKNVIEDEIMVYNFDDEDVIIKYIIDQMNREYEGLLIRQNIPNTSMKIQECWDILASKFTDYSLNWVLRAVDIRIIEWLHSKLKDLKK